MGFIFSLVCFPEGHHIDATTTKIYYYVVLTKDTTAQAAQDGAGS